MRFREGREKLTLNANVDVVLTGSLLVADGVFGFRERIEGLEVLDVRGHETGWTVSLLKRGWVSVWRGEGGASRGVAGAELGVVCCGGVCGGLG